MSDLSDLLQWASQSQAEVIRAIMRTSTQAEAAKELGLTHAQVRHKLLDVKRKAARAGFSPEHDMTHPVPLGFHAKGVSTYYGEDGKPRGQWVKSQVDQEHKLLMLAEAVRDIAEPFKGKSAVAKTPRNTDAGMLTVYPIGDNHLGMYAWAEECGESFNVELAEANLVAAVDKLVALAPATDRALIVNLGDFFHGDNSANMTARSGNVLDVDTRWARVLRAGIRTMRRCIDRAQEKHKIVRVINQVGNHDEHTAIMLSLCLASFYENNPRVEIDTSPNPFHYERFGLNLIGVTHGDGLKFADLPGIMATDQAQHWGETKYRYWLCGHVHHDQLKEYPGCIVETFRTLAPRDAWHNKAGYRAGRDMKCDVYSREYGRVLRHTVGIEKVRAK